MTARDPALRAFLPLLPPEDKPEDEGEEEKTPEARMNKARSMVSNLLGKKKEG